MSAKTRQAQLARLASLYVSATSLIDGGKRNKEMVSALLDALQFFKEGELGSVERNQSPELRRRRRLEFHSRYVKPWLERKSGTTPPEIVFDFSRSICATFFTGGLPELPILLQKPESFFSSLPQGQAVLREIKEKVAPYGLHFEMSQYEVEEAFGSPLETYLNL